MARGLRPAWAGVLAAVLALVAAPTAVAEAVPAAQADEVPSLDYADGPFADKLCDGEVLSQTGCSAQRFFFAASTGMSRRAAAEQAGSPCEQQSGLWVCFDVDSILAQRGGTTYGDTFLTPSPRSELSPELIAHELEHVRQWRLFGGSFTTMYLLQGTDACSNYFEVSAGLDAGGYDCD